MQHDESNQDRCKPFPKKGETFRIREPIPWRIFERSFSHVLFSSPLFRKSIIFRYFLHVLRCIYHLYVTLYYASSCPHPSHAQFSASAADSRCGRLLSCSGFFSLFLLLIVFKVLIFKWWEIRQFLLDILITLAMLIKISLSIFQNYGEFFFFPKSFCLGVGFRI